DRRDLELHAARHRQTYADQPLLDQQRIGPPFRLQARDVGIWTGRAIDETEDRISPGTVIESGCYAGRAHRPAGLRLVASEAGAAVGAEILKEWIVGRECGAAGLESRDRPHGIFIDLEFWDNGRSVLDALIGIFEATHGLHVIDHPGSKG